MVFKLWSGHVFTIVEFQREITLKSVWTRIKVFVFRMLYIYMKFCENILNGFQVIEKTQLYDGWTDRQSDNQGKNNMSIRGRHK